MEQLAKEFFVLVIIVGTVIPTKIVGRIVPTRVVGIAVNYIFVPATIVGTVVPTMVVGTTVPTIIALTAYYWKSCVLGTFGGISSYQPFKT